MDEERQKEIETEAKEANNQLDELLKQRKNSSLNVEQKNMVNEVQENLQALSPLMPHLDEILERLTYQRETVDKDAEMGRRIDELINAQQSLKSIANKNEIQI